MRGWQNDCAIYEQENRKEIPDKSFQWFDGTVPWVSMQAKVTAMQNKFLSSNIVGKIFNRMKFAFLCLFVRS